MNKHKQHEKEIVENDLVSVLEDKIGYLKPYWSQITLAACVAVLAILGGVFLWQQARAAEAAKWQNLTIAHNNYRRNLNNDSLKIFAEQYPDDQAGLWALLFAADAEMRSGLADFSTDRKAGFDKISKAKKFYQEIVDSTVQKSTMLQRRSKFGLAYAFESNGEFDQAAKMYQELVDSGADNPFADEATRGLNRSTNPEFAALYEKFRDHEDAPEEAPGMRLPKRPDISFPDVGSDQPNAGGGEFDPANSDSTGDVASDNTSDESGRP